MRLSELFEMERGNLLILLLSALIWGLIKINGLFNLVEKIGIEFTLALGVFVAYLVYFFLMIIYQWFFVLGRVKVLSVKNPKVKTVSNEHLSAKNYYGALAVEIPKSWTVTDCYITLEKITPVYFTDQKLLDEKTAKWFSGVTKPEYRMLKWESIFAYNNETKINIGENSNREIFFVGQVISGTIKDLYGNKQDFESFEFSLAKKNEEIISFTRPGLYEISLLLNWMRDGKRMIGKKIKCYLHASITGRERRIKVGLGKYKDDEDIPRGVL